MRRAGLLLRCAADAAADIAVTSRIGGVASCSGSGFVPGIARQAGWRVSRAPGASLGLRGPNFDAEVLSLNRWLDPVIYNQMSPSQAGARLGGTSRGAASGPWAIDAPLRTRGADFRGFHSRPGLKSTEPPRGGSLRFDPLRIGALRGRGARLMSTETQVRRATLFALRTPDNETIFYVSMSSTHLLLPAGHVGPAALAGLPAQAHRSSVRGRLEPAPSQGPRGSRCPGRLPPLARHVVHGAAVREFQGGCRRAGLPGGLGFHAHAGRGVCAVSGRAVMPIASYCNG